MGSKNRRQVYAYNPEETERLRRISLPAKLKCNMCLKNFNQANFSQKQLTDVRYQISTMGTIKTNPKCSKCTGGQLVEIECYMCNKTKGLEEFAKSQRKNTDEARCHDCTKKQVDREPVKEETYDPNNPRKAFVRTEGLGGRFPDYFAPTGSIRDTTSSFGDSEDTQSNDGSRRGCEGGGIDLSEQFRQSMSVSGEVSDTLIDSEFSYKPTGGQEPELESEVAGTRSWHTGSAASSSVRSSFIPNLYGGSSVSGSVHSFNSSIAERSQSGSDSIESRSGFAKIKAYKPPLQEDPWEDDKNYQSSSSSSDDEDDCDDDTVI